jgi:D-hexose-6-phosphate mutarotase
LPTLTSTLGKLTTSLTVLNCSDTPFTFEALLHTYIRVPGLAHTTVSGLQGLAYTDKVWVYA